MASINITKLISSATTLKEKMTGMDSALKKQFDLLLKETLKLNDQYQSLKAKLKETRTELDDHMFDMEKFVDEVKAELKKQKKEIKKAEKSAKKTADKKEKKEKKSVEKTGGDNKETE